MSYPIDSEAFIMEGRVSTYVFGWYLDEWVFARSRSIWINFWQNNFSNLQKFIDINLDFTYGYISEKNSHVGDPLKASHRSSKGISSHLIPLSSLFIYYSMLEMTSLTHRTLQRIIRSFNYNRLQLTSQQCNSARDERSNSSSTRVHQYLQSMPWQ